MNPEQWRCIGFRFGLEQASLPGKNAKKQLGTLVGEQLVLWEKLIKNAGIEKQ